MATSEKVGIGGWNLTKSMQTPVGRKIFEYFVKAALILICAIFFLQVLQDFPHIVGGLAALVTLLVALAGVVGALLPKSPLSLVVTRAADFHQPPEAIWRTITDYEKFPTWRRSLRTITSLPAREGRPRWRELFVNDKPMPFWVEVEEMAVNEKVVTRVTSPEWWTTRMRPPKVAFHGTWTWEISRTSTGSRLRITERREEKNPYLKILNFVLWGSGHPTKITNWLRDLGRKFGEEVKVIE